MTEFICRSNCVDEIELEDFVHDTPSIYTCRSVKPYFCWNISSYFIFILSGITIMVNFGWFQLNIPIRGEVVAKKGYFL